MSADPAGPLRKSGAGRGLGNAGPGTNEARRAEGAAGPKLILASSAPVRRRQLLPLALLHPRSPTALHELNQSRHQTGDRGEEEELPQLAALLLFVAHVALLTALWAWMDSIHRPHPYQG